MIKCPRIATAPNPASVLIAPTAVTSAAATGARSPISSSTNRIPIAISSVCFKLSSEALLIARSIDGCPVTYDFTGALIVRETRLSICGSSYLTASASLRSTDTTSIAAVGLLRSSRRHGAAIPRRQHARVRAHVKRPDKRRALPIQLRLGSFQQDRNELRRAKLSVRELLRARGLGAGYDGHRRRHRARHAEPDQRQGDADYQPTRERKLGPSD